MREHDISWIDSYRLVIWGQVEWQTVQDMNFCTAQVIIIRHHTRTYACARTHAITNPDSRTELSLAHQTRRANAGNNSVWYVEFKHELWSPLGWMMGQWIINALCNVKLYQVDPHSIKFPNSGFHDFIQNLWWCFPKRSVLFDFKQNSGRNMWCWFCFWRRLAGTINLKLYN